MNYTQQEYLDYLNRKSPDSKIVKDTVCAFAVGGLICTFGQLLYNIYSKGCGLDEETARTCVSITLIFISMVLTGLDLYGKIAKFAGGGTLVPITGFANAIVSPAMEFKKEGLVLGLAAKMFVIAGPVLVYGITASSLVGLISYLLNLFWG